MTLRPFVVAAVLVAACSVSPRALDLDGADVDTATPSPAVDMTDPTAAGGNTASGILDLSGVPVVVELDGVPRRVAGRVVDDGVEWEVLLGNGQRTAVHVAADGRVTSTVPSGLTGRVVLDDRGELLVEQEAVPPTGDVTPLPDTQVVEVGQGRVAVLADPTTAYGHGVLGDAVEADAVLVVDTVDGEVVHRLEPDPGRVVEQRGVLATVLDGRPAVVVTTSAHEDGARVEIWTLDGARRVVGPAIGLGGRWRHTIGVAATPDGALEVTEVVTPHLARIVSLLRVEGDALVQVAAVPDAIASHAIGSRDLDRAALVDVDGDGRRDAVGPAADGDGIAWVVAGEDQPHHADAGHRMASNLALVELADGRVAMAYGTETGQLVVRPGP